MIPTEQSSNNKMKGALKIAIIGQSNFAADVYKLLKANGHEITGVFTIPDKNNREDALALAAKADDTPCFKIKAWRSKGVMLPEVFELYSSIEVDLNVLPFCTQFIPMEVINHPKHKSICYHPSMLPRHRGASAISWTLIEGDETAGFTIFWADDGLDTGPILLQRECKVKPNDTLDSLYNSFMYPEGVQAMAEAVNLVAEGKAPMIEQPKEGATYDAMLNKKELQRLVWSGKTAKQAHDFVRALDSTPGAWTLIDGQEARLYKSSLWNASTPSKASQVNVDGREGLVHDSGLLIQAEDDHWINIEVIKLGTKTISASKFGQAETNGVHVEFSPQEKISIEKIREIWASILKLGVDDNLDFFMAGMIVYLILLTIYYLLYFW